MNGSVVIGLSAVVVAIRGTEAVVLTVGGAARAGPALCGLPSGPFDPDGYRTFELALRAFVADQTGFRLGWVEQLYTFGDKGRDAPLADVGAGAARVVSVGYLALSREAQDPSSPDTDWTPWTRFFPWEDWRIGRPAVVEREIEPALRDWAGEDAVRLERARSLFALDGRPWNEERVLERYELLYEAGLAPEARRDRGESEGVRETFDRRFGEPMRSDHRRILATGLGRLRGKLKYRPVVFELTPPEFTLSTLQRVVEAIAGLRLHKQNFRRGVARSGLATPVGRMELDTGGRPAALHRFAKERFAASPALGLPVPAAR